MTAAVILATTTLVLRARRKSPDLADEKEANLRGYGVEIVPVDDDALWREAARIKAAHAISLADSLAAATAKMKKTRLLVGRDEESQGLDIAIEVERIN